MGALDCFVPPTPAQRREFARACEAWRRELRLRGLSNVLRIDGIARDKARRGIVPPVRP